MTLTKAESKKRSQQLADEALQIYRNLDKKLLSQSKKQDYLFKIGNSTHIATLEKLVRELKIWQQSPGEKITGKNLKEVKKVHQVINQLKPNNAESNSKFYSAVKKYMKLSDVKIGVGHHPLFSVS